MNKRRKVFLIIAVSIFSAAAVLAIVFALLSVFIYKDINFEADERLFEGAKSFNSTVFYADASGSEKYEPVAIEISGSIRKSFSSLDDMSPFLTKGFVAVEDKLFYEHRGIDLKRTLMAAVNYVTKRDRVFGASTITQQVVKNISGDNQLKIKRKMGEIIRAIHIENCYNKDEILEVYLNVIPMSEGIYGVTEASRAYFGKEPSELMPQEAATLIGITNAPSAYNPYSNPEACKRKRNIVLGVMRSDGIITEEEYERAKAAPLYVIPRENRSDRFDSWFVETAIDEIVTDLADKYQISSSAARIMLLGGGYQVYTTMNPFVQNALEKYFENEENLAVETKSGLNYSMVVTDSKTGDLVGIIGRAGKKEGNRLLNHAVVPHIPGSVMKPIALYAPLIDSGRINWATVLDDVPVSFIETEDGYREYPRNSPGVYDGLTTAKDAIRLSKNTVAVRLCNILTPKSVFNSLKEDFGFDTLIEREGSLTDIAVAPMALGQLGRGVSLLKLTESYNVFSGEGVLSKVRSYIRLVDYNGKVILENEPSEKRIFKESTARIMNKMLMTVTESGTAKGISLKEIIDVAGKTGTSGGNRDKMFIGYTPMFTAGIWCGFDNSSVGISSMSKSHLSIWDEVMTEIHREYIAEGEREEFSGDGLLYLPYCRDSGGLYCERCIYDPRGNRREFGYFTEGNRPTSECSRHIICLYDSVTKAIACDGCPKENLVAVSLISVEDRAFPMEITVTDAEFVYRDIGRYDERPIDYALPYFEYTLPEGVFVGKSKGKKQFNSNCYIHSE